MQRFYGTPHRLGICGLRHGVRVVVVGEQEIYVLNVNPLISVESGVQIETANGEIYHVREGAVEPQFLRELITIVTDLQVTDREGRSVAVIGRCKDRSLFMR